MPTRRQRSSRLPRLPAPLQQKRWGFLRSESRLRRFVADASHELRTPLAAVRAYAEIFSRGASARPDDLARSMSGIGREAERMSLLLEDLLLLARLDEGRPLDRNPVELAEVAARSTPGEGATFTIGLPLAEQWADIPSAGPPAARRA